MAETLAERIAERLEITGLSERAASLQAGSSGDFIRNIRLNKSREPRREAIERLAKVLGVSSQWLRTGKEALPSTVEVDQSPTATPSDVEFAGYQRLPHVPRRDLPIRGTAAGSIIRTDVEGFVLNAEIIGYTERPPSLEKILEAYAILVTGDSMWPMHPPGRIRVVNPLRPTAPGDSVIVLTRHWEDDPGQAYIKILKRRTQQSVVLTQLNPHVDIEIPRQYVVGMHYVLDYEELLR